nr:MAG TPA: hypothetical protein [Caudoviricetes sp.]
MTVYAVVSASSFYFARGVLIMKSKTKRKRKRMKESKPRRYWEDMMGIHGQVLERHNHALRRKGR